MQTRVNFALLVSVLTGLVATSLLVISNGSDNGRRMEAADVAADPALEPQHRELTRHWFKKTANPNGLKTWRRNKWKWYNDKKKQGRAYRYYKDRPGWTPNPNREINILRRKGAKADPNSAALAAPAESLGSNDGRQLVIKNRFMGSNFYLDSACEEPGKEGVVRNLETNTGDRNENGSTRWTLEKIMGDPEVHFGDNVYVKNLYNEEEWYLGFNDEKTVFSLPQPVLIKSGQTAGYTITWTIESVEGKSGAVHTQDQVFLRASNQYLDTHGYASQYSSCLDDPNSGASTAIALHPEGERDTRGSSTWEAEYV